MTRCTLCGSEDRGTRYIVATMEIDPERRYSEEECWSDWHDPAEVECLDCEGAGTLCPSDLDKCQGCEVCERCGGTGADPGTPHPYLSARRTV